MLTTGKPSAGTLLPNTVAFYAPRRRRVHLKAFRQYMPFAAPSTIHTDQLLLVTHGSPSQVRFRTHVWLLVVEVLGVTPAFLSYSGWRATLSTTLTTYSLSVAVGKHHL